MMSNQTKNNNDKKPIIKAVIGLGNPGRQYYRTRHNIGFRILDALADKFNAHFNPVDNLEQATIDPSQGPVLLIKPQTFMNCSGKIVPYLKKKNIKPEEILIVHDELELPFGTIKMHYGGSHKGHNGLKSMIEQLGTRDFWRLRFGIGRPATREEVPDYVLEPFNESAVQVDQLIQNSVENITSVLN